jgi:hypothetical protein
MSCFENSGSHFRDLRVIIAGLINHAFCKNFHPHLNSTDRCSIRCIMDESKLGLFILRRIFLREKEMY